MNPLISVIIPVYNAEKTLEATVSSILKCSYRPLEIILVDDGSSDSSPALCDKLAKSENFIHAHHMQNGGAACARNKGMALAAGDFFAFIDSDDLINPDYFDVLYTLTKDYDADIAVCDYAKIYEKDINDISEGKYPTGKTVQNNTYCFDKKDAVKNLLYQRHFMSTPCCMISRRTLWDSLKFPEGIRAEDVATIYKLFFSAQNVAFTDKKLYYYYQRRESTVYSTPIRLNPDYLKNCLDIVEFMEKNMPDAVNAAYSRLFSACFQILSQTQKNAQNKKFCASIYKTIKDIRKIIISDKNGKPRNRYTAMASYLTGISFIHFVLRKHYMSGMSKL